MAASTNISERNIEGGVLRAVVVAGSFDGTSIKSFVPTSSTSKAASTTHVNEPASNVAAVVTLPAVAGSSNVVGTVYWSYDAAPTGGSLTISDGAGQTVCKVDITAGGPGFLPFTPPMKGSTNTAMIFTLTAGGVDISGIVSVHAWTE